MEFDKYEGEKMILSFKRLPDSYQSNIEKIIQKYSEEFVPPLSARTGTTQNSFEHINKKSSSEEYFLKMIKQAFIIDVEDDIIRGFLSYIPNYSLEINNKKTVCDYISTIIVEKNFRNHCITRNLYSRLFKDRSDNTFVTRTWSSNAAHIHILKTIGFRLFYTIKNDRGIGIDTVYYIKENSGFEK